MINRQIRTLGGAWWLAPVVAPIVALLVLATPTAAQCPGSGSCCEAGNTPGCDDVDCCTTVCDSDPFCCQAEWDGTCVANALTDCGDHCQDTPTECGHQAASDCFLAGDTPFCNDFCQGGDCAGCCDTVCAVDPFCCTIQWDGFCADGAAGLCLCDSAPPANDACASAIVAGLGDTPITNTCATSEGPDHPDCNDGFLAGLGPDVWLKYTADFTGDLTVSLCDQVDETWNPQIAAYEAADCTAVLLINPPTACNQDAPGCAEGSMITFPVSNGSTWFIRIGGQFDGPTGSGTVTLTSKAPPACSIDGEIPPGARTEPETCGEDGNGGCNATTPLFTAIQAGDVFHGEAWADEGARDTDWYELVLTQETEVTATFKSEFGFLFGFATSVGNPGSGDCIDADLINGGLVGSACTEVELTETLGAGTWWVFVAPNSFNGLACDIDEPGPSPVGNDYTLHIEAVPAVSCEGDTDGDGVVDVSDLTNVILLWGTDGQGAGVDADFDGNGVVDVGDLTEVIIGWGACV